MKHKRARYFWLGISVALIALGGGGLAYGHVGPKGKGTKYPAPGRYASYQGSPLPLDAYRESPLDARQLSIAITKLANDCRSSFGLSRALEPYLALQTDDQFARRYSLVGSTAIARRFGYHAQPQSGPSLTRPTPSTRLDNLVDYASPSGPGDVNALATTLVHGMAIPRGGCITEAEARVNGRPLDLGLQLAENLQDTVYASVMADPLTRSVHKLWSQCMANHRYSGLSDPGKVPYDYSSAQIPEAEKAQAVQDVLCQQSVRLVPSEQEVEIRLQRAAIAKNASALDSARRRLREAIARANVLAS